MRVHTSMQGVLGIEKGIEYTFDLSVCFERPRRYKEAKQICVSFPAVGKNEYSCRGKARGEWTIEYCGGTDAHQLVVTFDATGPAGPSGDAETAADEPDDLFCEPADASDPEALVQNAMGYLRSGADERGAACRFVVERLRPIVSDPRNREPRTLHADRSTLELCGVRRALHAVGFVRSGGGGGSASAPLVLPLSVDLGRAVRLVELIDDFEKATPSAVE